MCEKGEKVSVKINLTRLKKNIEELAKFGVLETGGICRESFSIADLAAKRWNDIHSQHRREKSLPGGKIKLV